MSDLANVRFHHPMLPVDLTIAVNPDQITWAYGLNTASFPTYGGEVVQILSVYIDDMTIAGTVSTYAELEQIYGWFITYMQFATQGRDGQHFNQHPVHFTYLPRGWNFDIWPKALPGFRYGRDVVAPTWKVVAAVSESDADFQEKLKNDQLDKLSKEGPISTFGVATADFGTTGDLVSNPWASPDAGLPKNTTMASYLSKQTAAFSDTFAGWVKALDNQQLDQLPEFQPLSKLAAKGPPTPTKKTAKSGKVGHR